MADIELKYKKRKCEHFCCGDCIIDGKSCGNDIGNDAVCIDKFNKYKQCLDEIEKIVNKHYGTILEFYNANKKVLQKIKEVKE